MTFFLGAGYSIFSNLATLKRQYKYWKYFLEKKAKNYLLWAKVNHSEMSHNHKHSVFEDLKQISDTFYLRSWVCNRTVSNFPKMQKGKVQKSTHSSEVLLTKTWPWFQGHMLKMSLFCSLTQYLCICIFMYMCMLIYIHTFTMKGRFKLPYLINQLL